MSNVVGKTFSFELKDGFLVGGGDQDFHLEPFDEVYIRRSPALSIITLLLSKVSLSQPGYAGRDKNLSIFTKDTKKNKLL